MTGTRDLLLPPVVADSTDEEFWLAARRLGFTGSDARALGTRPSATAIRSVLADKRGERRRFTNASMEHGHDREPVIAKWVASKFDIHPSTSLFAHRDNPRYLATPDGVARQFGFTGEIAEIKTTVKPFESIPVGYMRQMQWEMFVLGAEHCLFVWELRDENFQPVDPEPRCEWVKRDEATIADLRKVADELLEYMDTEEPPADVVMDSLISWYLDAEEKRNAQQARMDEIEKEIRLIGGEEGLRAFGTDGDLTLGVPATQTRFDSTRFRAEQPEVYKKFQKRIAVKGRLSITPRKEEGVRFEDGSAD